MALKNIPLTQIELGKRGRQNYGKLNELVDDIRRRGLICPIAVIDKQKAGLPSADIDRPYLLAAGGRRLAAVTHLDWSSIDCRVFERQLTELDFREIELYENLKRKDLDPQEELNMKSEIHDLLVKIHGPKISTLPDAPGHSLRDTAEAIGVNASNLSNDLKLKRTIDALPDVDWSKCKTKAELKRLANKLTRIVTNAVGAERVQKDLATNGAVKKICESFAVGDFFELSRELPNGYYDFCEIDPPYAIALNKKKKSNECFGYNEIAPERYESFLTQTFKIAYEKLRSDSWLVCWFGPDPWFPYIRLWLESVGFSTTGLVGIWAKGQTEGDLLTAVAGQTHMPTTRLANSYEMFYYAWKGSPKLNRPGISNLFACVPVPHQRKWHPTQRPRPLMRDILTTFVGAGSNVLVPFAGSGETLISSYKENMTAVGFDLTSTYKDAFVVEVGKEFGK